MNASGADRPVVEINMLANTNVFEFAYIAIIKNVLTLHIMRFIRKRFRTLNIGFLESLYYCT